MSDFAIVTGGAQGIGRAIALGFAREGAEVVVGDIDGAKAEALVREIDTTGSRSLAVQVDVSSEDSVIGITVNAICPGVTDTAQPRGHRSEQDLHAMARQIPLGRIGQPDDIVGPVLFLASDAASYITGQALMVTGGGFMF